MVEWQLHKRLSFNVTLERIEVNSAPRLLSNRKLQKQIKGYETQWPE